MPTAQSIRKFGDPVNPLEDATLEDGHMEDGPFEDGRQSEAALAIARGTQRCLIAHGFAGLSEFTLRNARRADLIAIADSGEIWIIEIKSNLTDFRADQKWPEYRAFCDRFFFAVAQDFPREVLPPDTGTILADRYGAEIIREAPEHKLAPARRKTLITRVARIAALRLVSVGDPEFRF